MKRFAQGDVTSRCVLDMPFHRHVYYRHLDSIIGLDDWPTTPSEVTKHGELLHAWLFSCGVYYVYE